MMAMIFKKDSAKRDWKSNLSEGDKEALREVLEMSNKHKYAFMEGEDPRIAQLWCAFLEMKKELEKMKAEQDKSQIFFKYVSELGEQEKKKAMERALRELLRPGRDAGPREKTVEKVTEETTVNEKSTSGEDAAIDKLVNSLVKS